MSVDVEDYFQVWAFSGVIDRSEWDAFPLRVVEATKRCLDIFAAHGATATFFMLGWVAERVPGLVRAIVDGGHEIASHGYDHRKVFDQTPDAFRADVRRTKDLLEQAAGVGVRGYRAAGFSIDARTPWAYDILAETGHAYSSSSHPIAHDHYGDPNAPRGVHRPLAGCGFLEAPVATARFAGRRVSAGGGGWFRAAPYAVSKRLLDAAHTDLDGPAIFYFHPWEVDPDQPRIPGAPMKARLRHYLNLRDNPRKLARLLGDFQWSRIDAALGLEAAP
ncbi:MAG: XrtA system polysaccharide deacetylase [Pseudomonadota bacterium]